MVSAVAPPTEAWRRSLSHNLRSDAWSRYTALICNSFHFEFISFVVHNERKLKRKRKQKRNEWRHLRGGASRPSRRFPRLRFCFRFRFRFERLGTNVHSNALRSRLAFSKFWFCALALALVIAGGPLRNASNPSSACIYVANKHSVYINTIKISTTAVLNKHRLCVQ